MGVETSTSEPRRACVITVVHQPFDVRIFYKQARTLAQNGWEVTLIAPCDESEQTVDGVRILGLPRAPRWRRPLNWFRAFRLAVRTGADIYHIHDPELLLLAPLIRAWARRPFIYDAHEVLVANIELKEWLPRSLRPWLARLAGMVEDALMRCTSAVVYANPPQARLYDRLSRSRPVILVANCPVRTHYDEPSHGPREHKVTFVGGLTAARGINVLLDAFSQVRARAPRAELWLVGPAEPPAYAELLRARAAELGMPASVRLLGRVPFPHVKNLLASSAVGIVTYLPLGDYSQCLPTKLFEYMACAVPCVCSNIPLWADIVERARCGLVVDPSDASAVAEAITYLLEHPDEAEQMGRRGREAFLAHYTWEQEGEKLVALYEELTTESRRQASAGA